MTLEGYTQDTKNLFKARIHTRACMRQLSEAMSLVPMNKSEYMQIFLKIILGIPGWNAEWGQIIQIANEKYHDGGSNCGKK